MSCSSGEQGQPHGLQPTRLLHPWDFPGKSTGVGCHCLLQHTHIYLSKNTPKPHHSTQHILNPFPPSTPLPKLLHIYTYVSLHTSLCLSPHTQLSLPPHTHSMSLPLYPLSPFTPTPQSLYTHTHFHSGLSTHTHALAHSPFCTHTDIHSIFHTLKTQTPPLSIHIHPVYPATTNPSLHTHTHTHTVTQEFTLGHQQTG